MHHKSTALATLCFITYANAFTQNVPAPYQPLNQAALVTMNYQPGGRALFLDNGLNKKEKAKSIRMSFKMKNATVVQILDEIKLRDTSYIFQISTDVHSDKTKADINIKNATVPEALEITASIFPIGYQIRKDGISVYLQKRAEAKPPVIDSNDLNASRKVETLAPVDVMVVFATGHRNIPAGKATDPYLQPDSNMYKTLSDDPNIISRFQAIGIPIMISSKNSLTGSSASSLRGPASLYGNPYTTNVVDGFRITNTDFYNPMDIERSTFIKTAAAGTEWGAMSANGVNVFETQSGISAGSEVNIFSSVTIGKKPDINYWKALGADAAIEVQKMAYDNGLLGFSPVDTVLAQMAARGQGWGDSILLRWSKNNLIKQINDQFYGNQVSRQLAVNVRSGSAKFKNYVSYGLDQKQMAEKGNTWRRHTFMEKSSYTDNNINVQVSAAFADILARNNFVPYPTSASYLNLYDENGNPLPMPYMYSPDVIAYAKQQGLFDVGYFPTDENRFSDDLEKQRYYSITGKASYNVFKTLRISYAIQFAHTGYDHQINHVLESFYTRNLLDQYRTKDAQGVINWNIPVGSIFDRSRIDGNIVNWRAQLDYAKKWNSWDVTGFLGIEQSRNDMELSTRRIYGKDISYPQSRINYDSLFPMSLTSGKAKIPYYDHQTDSADHFLSYYAGADCAFRAKYFFSVVARTDLSNRFDSSLNRFGVAFLSGAAAWDISKERFFSLPAINELKIRLSYGVNGNIDYTIHSSRVIQPVDYQGATYSVAAPKAPKLQWEKVYIGNAGVEFQINNGVVAGSIDAFIKRGTNMLNVTDGNPTTGFSSIRNNSGSLNGQGYDISLNTKGFSIAPQVNIEVTFLFTHSTSKVTSPSLSTVPAWQLVNPATSAPRTGDPVKAFYVFRAAGLDHDNGNPIGYSANDTSENYSKLVNATDGSSIECLGSATPTSFASLAPRIHYKQFTLSAVLIGKFGYYTWAKPLDYKALFQEYDGGTQDYYSRWQKPGDEFTTDVPSIKFPIDDNREFFSKYRTTNAIRADHVRLQTIQVSYNFDKSQFPKLPFKKLELFFSINNLGVIYRANKKGIDPDVPVDSYKTPRSYTFSIFATY